MVIAPPPVTLFDDKYIVRGDMVSGGLKTLALLYYLPRLKTSHVAYVGSTMGSGAWAVATASAALGYNCTLFIARSDVTPPWLAQLFATGTNIVWCDPLPVTTLHQTMRQDYPDLTFLPLGFDDAGFITDMAEALRNIIPSDTSEIWVSALSGVLARAACLAFSDLPVHAVTVAKYTGDIGRAIPHPSPLKFRQPAKILPPYSACPYSCAKIWSISQELAKPRSCIINIGY